MQICHFVFIISRMTVNSHAMQKKPIKMDWFKQSRLIGMRLITIFT